VLEGQGEFSGGIEREKGCESRIFARDGVSLREKYRLEFRGFPACGDGHRRGRGPGLQETLTF